MAASTALSSLRRVLLGFGRCGRSVTAADNASSVRFAVRCDWHGVKSRKSHNASVPQDTETLYKEVNIEVRGHDPTVLSSYGNFALTAANHLAMGDVQLTTLPKIIERRTLLKSIHKYGKYHKVQYERRTHFKVIQLKNLTGSTADTYLEYVQRHLPEGVAMKVVKTRLETLPEHLKMKN